MFQKMKPENRVGLTQNVLKHLMLCACLISTTSTVYASETTLVNATKKTVLLDGHCGNDEWDSATKIDLPANASIYLMHDRNYFYLCAKGKAQDYAVLDLYIENTKTGQLHKFHLSAQMGESILEGEEWQPAADKWDLKGFAGFWVPYSGLEDQENRKNPKFARGTHRQLQISRNKFAGNDWNMMIGLSAIIHEDNRNTEFVYPTQAQPFNKASWNKFLFSD